MKGGGAKKKATADAPAEVVEPSAAADLGVGEGGSDKVQSFEGNEGTQLRNGEDEEPQVEDSEGEGEEGEGEGEEEYGVEGDEEEENAGGAFPGAQGVVLAENFYEVEAIRRKRVRKGQVQYFIKWNGWPETANTWEPPENLVSVPDIVEAFEESLRSGRHRKRKRKHVVHHTQPKKRLERSTTPYSLRRFSSTVGNHSQSALPVLSDASLPVIPAFPQTVLFADELGNGAGSNLESAAPVIVNKSPIVSEQNVERNEENDYDPKLSELKASSACGNDADRLAIRIPEAMPSGPGFAGNNGQTAAKPKVVRMETSESGRCRGAKRRKSGSVKRFNKELYAGEPANTQNPIGAAVGKDESALLSRNAGSGGNHARPASNIVKIIKPIGYSASVASGAQDVLVTFVASKSDGTEVMVNNKYLKAFNPLLLINFYEQHLRYSPTS
ncbi:chromo domain protein LHP1 [Vigna radiata var. radiata]|uniref:Chromo domain protein LHP1 n=1 Tax=Vigna radiata var. radiata TaxID=3916 RepID=A0A1S3VEF3_VIGRR|nr:chromo domain protein LHP1 [Vigna radiata var. radiata]